MLPTSSDPSCQASAADLKSLHRTRTGIHPLLRGLAVEGRAVAVRVLAYVSGLALLAVIAADLLSALVAEEPMPDETAPPRTIQSDRATAINIADFSNRSGAYRIVRRPDSAPRACCASSRTAADWLSEAAPLRLRGPL